MKTLTKRNNNEIPNDGLFSDSTVTGSGGRPVFNVEVFRPNSI